MTYYTYNPATKALTRAPDPATIDGRMVVHPNAAMYATIGAYPMSPESPESPEPPEGKVAVPDGYELQSGAWVRTYRFDDAPESPKPVYDKYKLVMALEKSNLLADFVSLIKSDPVLDIKWSAAQHLDYEDDTLANALAAIKESLGVTDEQVAAILKEAEV